MTAGLKKREFCSDCNKDIEDQDKDLLGALNELLHRSPR